MRFHEFLFLTENDPMGGAPGAPPLGGMGGPAPGGPPPIGGAPPGGALGGMGGDPMGGAFGGMGGPPGGGMASPQSEPPVIPRYADVWDVLDHLLNKKPLKHDQQKQQSLTDKAVEPAGIQASGTPEMPGNNAPMGGMPGMGPALMS